VDVRAGSLHLPLLAVSIHHGVVRRDSLTGDEPRADDLSTYKVCHAGDIVVNRMRAFQGGVGMAPVPGIVSPDYLVLRTAPGLEPRFFHYLFRSTWFVGEMTARLRGIGGSDQGNVRTPRINAEDLGEIPVKLPSTSEQKRIVALLDAETAHIDALIEKKGRMIDLLAYRRQALTDLLVLGIDKPDRVASPRFPWIAGLPSGWTVRSLRHLAAGSGALFTDGDWIESPYITDSGIRLIQTGNVGIGRYREQGFRYISEQTFHQLRCTEVLPSDVLICRLASPVGRACLAPDLDERMITSVDVCILRASQHAEHRFLVYYLSSTVYLSLLEAMARGGTRERVSREQLGAVPVPLPPISEQRHIADQLDDATASIERLSIALNSQIAKLREHLQALITAAVTGELDLSEAA
jgi:type I restriction enzyme S subunit